MQELLSFAMRLGEWCQWLWEPRRDFADGYSWFSVTSRLWRRREQAADGGGVRLASGAPPPPAAAVSSGALAADSPEVPQRVPLNPKPTCVSSTAAESFHAGGLRNRRWSHLQDVHSGVSGTFLETVTIFTKLEMLLQLREEQFFMEIFNVFTFKCFYFIHKKYVCL